MILTISNFLFIHEENFVGGLKVEEVDNEAHQAHETALKNYEKHKLEPPRILNYDKLVPDDCHRDVLRHHENKISNVPRTNILEFHFNFKYIEDEDV